MLWGAGALGFGVEAVQLLLLLSGSVLIVTVLVKNASPLVARFYIQHKYSYEHPQQWMMQERSNVNEKSQAS